MQLRQTTVEDIDAAFEIIEQARARIAAECGFQSVRIDTHLGNVPMRGLLEKCGYSQCGVFLLANREEPTRERVAYEKIVA